MADEDSKGRRVRIDVTKMSDQEIRDVSEKLHEEKVRRMRKPEPTQAMKLLIEKGHFESAKRLYMVNHPGSSEADADRELKKYIAV